ncbi:hypothetical protein FA95DRAFT_1639604, partial [Auriscalpium vulgare]
LSNFQAYFSLIQDQPRIQDLPRLSEPLLTQAHNCRKHSLDNNYYLAFIGDRCINLVAALLVDKVRMDQRHHEAVRLMICTNDIFGRIAFCPHLDDVAEFDLVTEMRLEHWSLQSKHPPPKALADLLEAYAGAVFVHRGGAGSKRS